MIRVDDVETILLEALAAARARRAPRGGGVVLSRLATVLGWHLHDCGHNAGMMADVLRRALFAHTLDFGLWPVTGLTHAALAHAAAPIDTGRLFGAEYDFARAVLRRLRTGQSDSAKPERDHDRTEAA